MVDSDMSASLPPSKKQRHLIGLNPFQVEDRLSSLPDTILCSVLSLLSTKEAIKTSVLSKQWKDLWTSVFNITLNDERCDQSQLDRFVNFVQGVMFRHDALNIVKFGLAFSVPIKQLHVNVWIGAAISRRVEELMLTLSSHAKYEFPFFFFSFDTLTVLHLQNCSLKISTTACFQNLKKCHLVHVTLLDRRSTHCRFPHCPVLGDLVFENCFWKKHGVLIIDVPSLKICKVEFNNLYIFVKIYAPNLEDLDLNGCFTWVDSVLCNLEFLIMEPINSIMDNVQDDDIEKRAIRLFNALRVVKSFEIPNVPYSKVELLAALSIELKKHIPTFHNLTHLKLFFDDRFPQGVYIMRLLLRLPKLEYLSMDVGRETDWFWVYDPVGDYCAPPDLKLVLKQVSIAGFTGYSDTEMPFVEVMLEHSVYLERLDILCDDSLSDKYKEKLGNKLQMLPRGSSSCVIQLR